MNQNQPQTENKIETRQARQKEELIEELKHSPIVQLACRKTGVGRTTYYRWLKDDGAFADAADEAIETGAQLVNDMAESQLLAAIRDRNLTAIIFWLKYHHPTYATRIELTAKQSREELTPEQETAVRKALELSGLLPESKKSHDQ